MAKKQRIDQQLFNELRRSGLRKRVARDLATAQKAASSRAPETLRRTVADLTSVLSDLEKRVPGRGTSSRSAAAKKAAATRKRAASRRSTAAKKAAATRSRKTSSGTRRSSGSRSGGTRRSTTRRSTSRSRS
jgi:hypothetical protein